MISDTLEQSLSSSLGQVRIQAGPKGMLVLAYRVGGSFKALNKGVLLVPLDSRYTQIGFNIVFVQVCVTVNKVCYSKCLSKTFDIAF